MSRRFQRKRKTKFLPRKQREGSLWYIKPLLFAVAFVGGAVLLGYGAFALFNLVKPYLLHIGIGGIFLLVSFALLRFMRYWKWRSSRGELHPHILSALKAMDSTSKTYSDEEEANKELTAILKAQGFAADYQFFLNDRRHVDIRVNSALVEGKLEPDTGEIDRLLGQLQAYSQSPCKEIYIVIYGVLKKENRERIRGVIKERYPKKVFLVHLENAKRSRAFPNTGGR